MSDFAEAGADLVFTQVEALSVCYVFAAHLGDTTNSDMAARMYEWLVDDPVAREVEPPRLIDLPAGPAYHIRLQEQLEPGVESWTPTSLYMLEADGRGLLVDCMRFVARPDDDWLSIVETIEFLPVEE